MPTDFKQIVYNKSDHSYSVNGKRLMSVTTLVKHLTPPFARDEISASMAEARGLSQDDILKEWERRGHRARERGTRLHQFVEDYMNGKIDPILQAVNNPMPEMQGFTKAWQRMKTTLQARLIGKEWVIGDEELGIAGRVDALLQLGTEISVFDWKTGSVEQIDKWEKCYGGERLLPPLDKYPSTKRTQYSIQVSLYRLILERNRPKNKFGDGYFLYLGDDASHQLFRADDYRAELADWLKNGVPADVVGDPDCEHRTARLVRALERFGMETLGRASLRTRQELCQAAERIRRMCVNHDPV